MKRIAGGMVLVLGLSLSGWLSYNLFVQEMPEMAGRSPIAGLVLSAALIFFGLKWLMAEQNRS